MSRCLWFVPLLLIVLLSSAGCSRHAQPTAPTADALQSDVTLGDPWSITPVPNQPGGRMPLEVGDVWHYRVHDVYTFLDSVTHVPIETGVYDTSYEYRITGFGEINGIRYAIVDQTGPNLMPYSFGWRQDRTGLYEYFGLTRNPQDGAAAALPAWPAVAARVPALANSAAWRRAWDDVMARRAALARTLGPVGADAVPVSGETQRLAYPLVRGQSWSTGGEMPVVSVIEGIEMLRTGAGTFTAWRVGMHAAFYGRYDTVAMYWANSGWLGLRAHFVADAVDNSGHVIGLVAFQQEELVDSLHLVRR